MRKSFLFCLWYLLFVGNVVDLLNLIINLTHKAVIYALDSLNQFILRRALNASYNVSKLNLLNNVCEGTTTQTVRAIQLIWSSMGHPFHQFNVTTIPSFLLGMHLFYKHLFSPLSFANLKCKQQPYLVNISIKT